MSDKLSRELLNGNFSTEYVSAYFEQMVEEYSLLAYEIVLLELGGMARSKKSRKLMNNYFDIQDKFLAMEGFDTELVNECTKSLLSLRKAISKDTANAVFSEEYLKMVSLSMGEKLIAETADNPAARWDDEEMCAALLKYIFTNEKDAYMINYNIKSVFSDLPLRLTKSKFLEIVERSLKIYTNPSKAEVDKIFDNLYFVSGIASNADEEKIKNSIREKYCFEGEKKAKAGETGTEEEIKKLYKNCKKECEDVAQHSDSLCSLIALCNRMLAIVYLTPFTNLSTAGAIENYKSKIRTIMEYVKNAEDIPEETETAIYEDIEGNPEARLEKLNAMEPVIEKIAENNLFAKLPPLFEDKYKILSKVLILMGDEAFAELEKKTEEEASGSASIDAAAYRTKKQKEFITALEREFACNERQMKRAIMRRLMGELPPFCDDTNELESFILGSLKNCTSTTEKYVKLSKYI